MISSSPTIPAERRVSFRTFGIAAIRYAPTHGSVARDDLNSGIRIPPMLDRVVVAYRVTPSAILITRVFYGGQDYEAILRCKESEDDRRLD